MKFRFRFQTVLDHRQRLLEEAQEDYAKEKRKLDDQLAVIQNLYSSIDQTRQRASLIQTEGGTIAGALGSYEDFIQGTKVKIETEKHKVREMMTIVEQKMQVMIERQADVKAMEKLREKGLEEFKKMQRQKEQKEIDDIIVVRHNRKLL